MEKTFYVWGFEVQIEIAPVIVFGFGFDKYADTFFIALPLVIIFIGKKSWK